MRKRAAIAMATIMGWQAPTWAGPYTDDLGRCLVDKTTAVERTQLTRWVFAAAAANPALQGMTTITDADRERYDREIAALVSRLIRDECRSQAVEAIRHDGSDAAGAGLETLGAAIGDGLFDDPSVMRQIDRVQDDLDEAAFEAIRREAARPRPTQSKNK